MIDHYGYKRKNRLVVFLVAIVLVLIVGFSGIGVHRYLSESKNAGEIETAAGIETKHARHIESLVASNDISPGQYWIRVRKSDFILELYKGKDLEKQFPIAVGAVTGNKIAPGDDRTPEGVFTVKQIQDSKYWVHDFGDGNGPVEGAYGPFFIRLDTGWEGIGIHGTHNPSSVGSNITAGCIRMLNDDLREVVGKIEGGSIVVIEK